MSSVIWYELFCNLETLFSTTVFFAYQVIHKFFENFIIMKECVFNVSVVWQFISDSKFHSLYGKESFVVSGLGFRCHFTANLSNARVNVS